MTTRILLLLGVLLPQHASGFLMALLGIPMLAFCINFLNYVYPWAVRIGEVLKTAIPQKAFPSTRVLSAMAFLLSGIFLVLNDVYGPGVRGPCYLKDPATRAPARTPSSSLLAGCRVGVLGSTASLSLIELENQAISVQWPLDEAEALASTLPWLGDPCLFGLQTLQGAWDKRQARLGEATHPAPQKKPAPSRRIASINVTSLLSSPPC